MKIENAPYVTAFITFFSSFTVADWGVIVSMLVTVMTLLIHWAYKAKEYKLKLREFEFKLQQAQGKTND